MIDDRFHSRGSAHQYDCSHHDHDRYIAAVGFQRFVIHNIFCVVVPLLLLQLGIIFDWSREYTVWFGRLRPFVKCVDPHALQTQR